MTHQGGPGLSGSWLAIIAATVGLVTALSAASRPSSAQAPTQAPSFRSGVDLVSLNVTVTEGASTRFVTGLTESDFSVYEDGVKQDVTYFTGTKLPIALALLVDTSASMDSKLPTAQKAAIEFARRLRPQDLAEVIDFDLRVTILQGFTNDLRALEQAIHRTSAGGSTALYNAIYVALKDLKKAVGQDTEEIRRQAIVVLSDGADTASLLGFDEVLDLARRSATAVYTINLEGTDNAPMPRGFNEAAYQMRQFAQETGGRAFFPKEISDLTGVYAQISDELSSQYTLGYTSKNAKRDGAWRRVVVRVEPPNVARTKQGYFAPTVVK
ncbi:MAG: VWA domain-containing protein [Vicinamibacterales bacterium]